MHSTFVQAYCFLRHSVQCKTLNNVAGHYIWKVIFQRTFEPWGINNVMKVDRQSVPDTRSSRGKAEFRTDSRGWRGWANHCVLPKRRSIYSYHINCKILFKCSKGQLKIRNNCKLTVTCDYFSAPDSYDYCILHGNAPLYHTNATRKRTHTHLTLNAISMYSMLPFSISMSKTEGYARRTSLFVNSVFHTVGPKYTLIVYSMLPTSE